MILGLAVLIPLAHLLIVRGGMGEYRRALQVLVFSLFLLWSLGRPTAVLIADRLRKDCPAPSSAGVSVVVPCCNAASTLPDTVATLLAQSYRPLEIVLVENNSTDLTLEIIRSLEVAHPEVRGFTVTPPRDEYAASVAINYGVLHASYDTILRLDDDTFIAQDAAARGLAEMEATGAVAVACDLRVANADASIWTRLQAVEYLFAMDVDRRAQLLLDSILCCSGGMSMFRRSKILDGGGFVSAPRVVSEDMDMTLKAHRVGRVAMAPESIGFTEVPATLRSLVRQRFRWAISGFVSFYLHRGGLLNERYWHNGTIGFIGLPLRGLIGLRDLIAPLFLLDLWLLFAHDGPHWFAAMMGARAVLMVLELAFAAPALNRRDTRQGLGNWWLAPFFVLAYGPLLLATRFIGTWAGVGHVIRLRRKSDEILARGLRGDVELAPVMSID